MCSRPRHHGRAIVLIMVVAILVTLTMAATAFVVFMREANQAASNARDAAQAELSARSGLEHAIRAIEEALDLNLYVHEGGAMDVAPAVDVYYEDPADDEDSDGFPDGAKVGWYRYFEPMGLDIASGRVDRVAAPIPLTGTVTFTLGDPTVTGAGTAFTSEIGPGFLIAPNDVIGPWSRVSSVETDGSLTLEAGSGVGAIASPAFVSRGALGRVFELRTLGWTAKRGEYDVCVVDLDGRLHVDIDQWKAGRPTSAGVDIPTLIEKVAEAAGLAVAEAQALVTRSTAGPDPLYERPFSSLSEIARRAGADTVAKGKYKLERHFTVYPGPLRAYVSANAAGAQPGTSEITLTADVLTQDEHIAGFVVFEGSAVDYAITDNTGNSVTVLGDSTVETATRLTVYPPRPAVNVNTAREEVLEELIKAVESFKDPPAPGGAEKAEALAKHLVAMRAVRPFTNHHEIEEAVRRVSGEDAVVDLNQYVTTLPLGTYLNERQFNDVLNSFAGVIGEGASAYDEPLNPGVYSFNCWPAATGPAWGTPSQTGGDHSDRLGNLSNLTNDPSHNVTWSTELKFTSRFFHIYVVGRAWKGTLPVAGARRLHAIYDSRPPGNLHGRVIWMRWNLSSRGSVSDFNP